MSRYAFDMAIRVAMLVGAVEEVQPFVGCGCVIVRLTDLDAVNREAVAQQARGERTAKAPPGAGNDRGLFHSPTVSMCAPRR